MRETILNANSVVVDHTEKDVHSPPILDIDTVLETENVNGVERSNQDSDAQCPLMEYTKGDLFKSWHDVSGI